MSRRTLVDRLAKSSIQIAKIEAVQVSDMDWAAVKDELVMQLHDAALRYGADLAFNNAIAFEKAEKAVKDGDIHEGYREAKDFIKELPNREQVGRIEDLWLDLIRRKDLLPSDLAVSGQLFEAEVVNDDNLSVSDIERLAQLEFSIERGIEGYVEAGKALKEIRDSRLYAQYGTFEDYCYKRFRLSRSRAYQLVGAVIIIEGLSTKVDVLPSKESHVRALAAVPEEMRIMVWAAVLGDAVPVTVPKIQAAAKRLALASGEDKPSPPASSPRGEGGNNKPESSKDEHRQLTEDERKELETYEQYSSPVNDDMIENWNPNLWETPDWLATAIANLIEDDEFKILEPCAGSGQIVKAILETCNRDCNLVDILAIEIIEKRAKKLSRFDSVRYSNCDFFESNFCDSNGNQARWDLVVTNPPFDGGLDILEKSLTLLNSTGRCLFLLPIAYFQSQERGNRFLGMDAHIFKIHPVVGRVAYLKNGIAESGRQCEDAIFDIRVGKSGGCMEFITQ